MILLRLKGQGAVGWVGIFGVGLIGSALAAALRKRGAAFVGRYPITWDDPAERTRQFAAIENVIATSLGAESGSAMQIVWSAGRCGFGASETEAAAERDVFDEAVAAIERAARRSPGSDLRFLLIGTAGGLFEGQRRVCRASQPDPKRPYGRLKFHQEQRIQAEGVPWTPQIVRLSSVVGPIHRGRRRGLISTLIANGMRRMPTRIVGRMETLRDFISVKDVATFLAAQIARVDAAIEFPIMTLVSSKPSSLGEIQRLVERVTGRRLYVSYSLAPSNDLNITFSADLNPPDWAPSDLFESVRSIYQEALSRGTTE